jgi:hypothetical protein
MRYFALIAILLTIHPSSTQCASIGLFSTPDCTSCSLSIASGETRTFYIKAILDDLPLQGAEFKIEGLPAGWQSTSVPTSRAAAVFGDPLGSRGANIAFATVVGGDCFLFFTVAVTATTAASNVALRVVGATPPSDPYYPCPLLVMACGPCEWSMCVPGGELFINSNTDCIVAVQPGTWSEVKRLFE